MEQGMLFHFISKPFVNLDATIENKKELMKFNDCLKFEVFKLQIKFYILKPIILCVTCMASVWGTIIFFTFNPVVISLFPYWIVSCFATAFLNTIIYSIYAKIDI